MATISAKGRVKKDGTLDLHVITGLPETDVEILPVLEPIAGKNEVADRRTGWPQGYFENTFGSLRDIRSSPSRCPILRRAGGMG